MVCVLCENFLYVFKAALTGRTRCRLGAGRLRPLRLPHRPAQTPVSWRERGQGRFVGAVRCPRGEGRQAQAQPVTGLGLPHASGGALRLRAGQDHGERRWGGRGGSLPICRRPRTSPSRPAAGPPRSITAVTPGARPGSPAAGPLPLRVGRRQTGRVDVGQRYAATPERITCLNAVRVLQRQRRRSPLSPLG